MVVLMIHFTTPSQSDKNFTGSYYRYCTRHTFINCLYSKGVQENVIKALLGQEKEFIMKHYGGDPFSTERLSEEVSKVNC